MNYRKKFLQIADKFKSNNYGTLGMLIDLIETGKIEKERYNCKAEDFKKTFSSSSIKPEDIGYCAFLLNGVKLSDCDKNDVANALN